MVRGVEIIPAAIENAKENAKLNGFTNTEFFVGKAEEVLPEQYARTGERADVIVVDPPRKGCDETLLATIIEMQPDRVVYVSCDSATLARRPEVPLRPRLPVKESLPRRHVPEHGVGRDGCSFVPTEAR